MVSALSCLPARKDGCRIVFRLPSTCHIPSEACAEPGQVLEKQEATVMRVWSYSPMGVARRAVLAGLVLLVPVLAAVPAAAANPAETFVAENIQRGLQILNNPGPQRAGQFQTFLEGLTDISRIGRFTLGAARRAATAEDVAAFDAAFKTYAVAVYQSRLSAYSGQTLKVTGSTQNQPGDYTVMTVMVDPSAEKSQQPLAVGFRVVTEQGRFVVIDVSVAGVWLSIEERDQFSAFLSQHNGSIPALATHLNQLTAQLRTGNGR
jgi:phospholipid transport system substrate-binding protein